MGKKTKVTFYVFHSILLLYSLLAILTWRTEFPDGTIVENITGFVLLPVVIPSLLRLSFGRLLLLLLFAYLWATSITATFTGYVIDGVIGLAINGVFFGVLYKLKPIYTPFGIFKKTQM